MKQKTVSFTFFNSQIESELKLLKSRAYADKEKAKELNKQLSCNHNIVESGRAGVFGFCDIDRCTVCGYECFY